MSSWLDRRGPDDHGVWIGPGVGLAIRRLSIIDLSAAGHQPMLTPDGSAAIVFNGEIYGFLALREELESRGIAFRSHSDTEVLLQGFLTWGIDGLLERIDGMYALALFDHRDRTLYLARDRFGQKPLYYCLDPDRLLFSSDIRSIWAVRKGLSLDFEAMDYYLSELSMPQPRTIWKEIRQVEPATRVTVRLDAFSCESRRYWRIPSPAATGRDADDLARAAEIKLAESVRKTRVADVPIGSFLSGGIDSGLVVAALAGETKEPIRTYTIGFPGSANDERAAAAAVARRLGTVHTELDSEDVTPELVEELCVEYGEPFADPSALPTFLVSRAMREHCKVVLSGDGGDEVFGGYWEYPAASLSDELRSSRSGAFRQWALRAKEFFWRRTLGRGPSSGMGVGHALEFAAQSGYQMLHRGLGFHPDRLGELYASGRPCGFARRELERQWLESRQETVADTLFAASLGGRLLNDYLVKVDRASMASSLEVRIPFLDRSLVEFAFSLPAREKLPGHRAKGLLKRIAEQRLGRERATAPKTGFGLPLGDLLRGPLRPLVSEHLSEHSVRQRGFFDGAAVGGLLRRFESGQTDNATRVWALLVLELWSRSFLDQEGHGRR
jgi:asparagine synthase (glutamine-hydrolysing)